MKKFKDIFYTTATLIFIFGAAYLACNKEITLAEQIIITLLSLIFQSSALNENNCS